MNLQKPEDDILITLFHQYTAKEIAAMFSVPEEKVDRWIIRAKQRLAEQGITITRQINKPDKETLVKLIEKNTMKEIAKRYNVTPRVMKEWYTQYDLGKCPAKDELLEDFKTLSYDEVAHKYTVTVSTVRNWIVKYGIQSEVKALNSEQKRANYPDKEQLLELFHIMKASEIAKLYNVSQCMITKLIHQYNCEAEVKAICDAKKPTIAQLQELHKTKSVNEMAEIYQVSPTTIYTWLKNQ